MHSTVGVTHNMERRYLTNSEAAAYCGYSPRTFETLRVRGGGARFFKRAGKVLYSVDDLTAWIESKSFSCTADYGRAA